jgi:hypothetical protein
MVGWPAHTSSKRKFRLTNTDARSVILGFNTLSLHFYYPLRAADCKSQTGEKEKRMAEHQGSRTWGSETAIAYDSEPTPIYLQFSQFGFLKSTYRVLFGVRTDFSLFQRPDRLRSPPHYSSAPHAATIYWVLETLSSGIKRTGSKAEYSAPPSTEAKMSTDIPPKRHIRTQG